MKVIKLSRYLLSQRSYADSLDTITHEVAHAIVGPKHGHDAVWARQHRAMGGNGQRCFQHTDDNAPYQATCKHGNTVRRYRAARPGQQFRIRACRCIVEYERVR
jgi:predicted SprT family Zn-dependent metalloprotease